jgi:FkbM family methyltransferase
MDGDDPTLKLKRTLQRGLWSLGYHVGRFPPADSLSHHLRLLLSRLEIDCVLDVGAHEGEFARSLRDLGYSGTIVSFEPVKETYARLSAAFADDPNWRGRNVALGSENGMRAMNIYRGSMFNSFLGPSDFGRGRFEDLARPVRSETVAVQRLEDVIREQRECRPNCRLFLKMDTQGWDLPVLEGAGPELDKIVALQTEVSVKPIYDDMTGFAETITRLGELGFELTGVFPVARDTDELRLIEIDCVLMRTAGSHPGPRLVVAA